MTKKTLAAINDLWSGLHHNVSLLHLGPITRNDWEADRFNTWLDFYRDDFAKMLTERVVEEFGVKLGFYYYGRGGATLAPETWMCNKHSGEFSFFNEDVLEELDEDLVERVLVWLDREIEQGVRDLEGEWKEEKSYNRLTDEYIAQFDNARKVVYSSARWVDKVTGKELVVEEPEEGEDGAE